MSVCLLPEVKSDPVMKVINSANTVAWTPLKAARRYVVPLSSTLKWQRHNTTLLTTGINISS
uniref:Uncharacterized protein n=1 Tax=Anguilla anguilla TaxID=7936 RepID=A0A0E9XBW4_ANGAN